MKRGLTFTFLIAALVAALLPLERGGSFQKLNQTFVSWLSANAAKDTSSPSITLLRLEEGDWSSWPPGPLDFATIFSNLDRFSPPTVAVEPVLDWEDPHPQQISSLSTHALAVPSLLLGIGLQVNPAAADILDPTLLSLFETLPNVSGDISRIPTFTGIHAIPTESVRRPHYLGHTYIDLSEGHGADQDVLKVPLLARYGDHVVPSFVLQAVLLKGRLPLSLVRVVLGDSIQAGESLRIPIDASGNLAVSPDWKRQIPSLSADVLLAGDDPDPTLLGEGESIAALETLRTNLVLIGPTGPGVRSFERPGGGRISRTEIFAAAIATIQSGRFSIRLPDHLQYLAWAAAALFALLTALFARRRPSAVTAAALGLLAIAIISLIAFQSTRHWCPPTIPAAIVLLGSATAFFSPRHPLPHPVADPDANPS